jgi:hypothetical protein
MVFDVDVACCRWPRIHTTAAGRYGLGVIGTGDSLQITQIRRKVAGRHFHAMKRETMSESSPQAEYARLVQSQRIASLGTLRDGAPFVSMVPYAETEDLSSFLIHISGLAQHTQDILADARVGLMVAAPDDGSHSPQSLPRVSLQGRAVVVPKDSAQYAEFADRYLQKFPDAAMMFSLGDFEIYRIEAQSARFVAGFGKIFNFGKLDFQAAARALQSSTSTPAEEE